MQVSFLDVVGSADLTANAALAAVHAQDLATELSGLTPVPGPVVSGMSPALQEASETGSTTSLLVCLDGHP